MGVPGAEKAVVAEAKVRGYILSMTHPVGRHKAAFFLSMGYTIESWSRLAQDLRSIGATGDTTQVVRSAYGWKYRVRGRLQGPVGHSAVVVSVWILREPGDAPRLVTAFPGDP